jgi:hypothetical protein
MSAVRLFISRKDREIREHIAAVKRSDIERMTVRLNRHRGRQDNREGLLRQKAC